MFTEYQYNVQLLEYSSVTSVFTSPLVHTGRFLIEMQNTVKLMQKLTTEARDNDKRRREFKEIKEGLDDFCQKKINGRKDRRLERRMKERSKKTEITKVKSQDQGEQIKVYNQQSEQKIFSIQWINGGRNILVNSSSLHGDLDKNVVFSADKLFTFVTQFFLSEIE